MRLHWIYALNDGEKGLIDKSLNLKYIDLYIKDDEKVRQRFIEKFKKSDLYDKKEYRDKYKLYLKE